MNNRHEEKRRFKRIFHDAKGLLITSQGTSFECTLLDISFNGCLISSQYEINELQAKDNLSLKITLGETLTIEAFAHIAYRRKDKQLGLQFDGIDIHSATSLRRLVELNMGDTSLLERDLLSLSVLNTSELP